MLVPHGGTSGQEGESGQGMSGRASKNHQAKEETMSLNRKAIVLAVGAALAAPAAYAQTSDKWEFYGKFYPELTHASGDGATAQGTTGLSTLVATPNGTGAIINRWE